MHVTESHRTTVVGEERDGVRDIMADVITSFCRWCISFLVMTGASKSHCLHFEGLYVFV